MTKLILINVILNKWFKYVCKIIFKSNVEDDILSDKGIVPLYVRP